MSLNDGTFIVDCMRDVYGEEGLNEFVAFLSDQGISPELIAFEARRYEADGATVEQIGAFVAGYLQGVCKLMSLMIAKAEKEADK